MPEPWILDYTLSFLRVFAVGLLYSSPILLSFLLLIAFFGWCTGRIEKWSLFDSLYYAFITATTVGYGDIRPRGRRAKILAVAIAFFGLLFTGFTVTLGLHAASYCFSKYELFAKIEAAEKKLDDAR